MIVLAEYIYRRTGAHIVSQLTKLLRSLHLDIENFKYKVRSLKDCRQALHTNCDSFFNNIALEEVDIDF